MYRFRNVMASSKEAAFADTRSFGWYHISHPTNAPPPRQPKYIGVRILFQYYSRPW
ncbi:hypothetical protein C8Q74DRAFT_552776 [Fomes fomentarius]|nr:hypothetical protein C8Q74DRAFT_552776 [Fomes fomentarius]